MAATRPQPGESRGWLLLNGVLGVIAGLVVLARPGLPAIVLLHPVALWAIATGITQPVTAVALLTVAALLL
ncbi:MAG TPA: hypothetical protein VGT98_10180, partial [Candidatus Elarobacter sp.]|nr:hypothetical protein [Candidatus Elarobacter sp.]